MVTRAQTARTRLSRHIRKTGELPGVEEANRLIRDLDGMGYAHYRTIGGWERVGWGFEDMSVLIYSTEPLQSWEERRIEQYGKPHLYLLTRLKAYSH